MLDAANQLKNAMGSMVTYAGTPTATVLAKFESQYKSGVSDWNDAVTVIWTDAGQTPPTL